jgi:protein-disulfide isomerase
MANEKPAKTASGVPLAIIAIVLIVAAGAGYWLYNSSTGPKQPKTGPTPTNTNTRASSTPANAPLGAQPPNSLGPQTADVTVEEFADFQCPQCGATHPVIKELQGIYSGKVRFIFRNYPLAIPAHDKAYDAAVAAEAAGIQGKYWQMQDKLFMNQKGWSDNPNYRQLWADYAKDIGLDVDKWQADISGLAAKARVDEDLKRGRGLNINSTPTIYINGRPVQYQDFSVAAMRNLIDAEIQRTAAAKQNPGGAGSAASASNAQ